MRFLRNYFLVFLAVWTLLLAGKILFYLMHLAQYGSYPVTDALAAMLWGSRFDFAPAAAVALAVSFVDFSPKAARTATALLLTSLAALQLSDILYFEDSGRHIGYEITDALNDAGGLFLTAWTQHPVFTAALLLGIPLSLPLFYRWPGRRLSPVPLTGSWPLKKLLLVGISVFFIRGMFASIPLNPWQASQIGDEKLATLAVNGAYGALFSLVNTKGDLKRRTVGRMSDADIRKVFAEIYDDTAPYQITPEPRNVVLFFLESWSGAHMKPYGFGETTTPFYDSVLPHSLRPKAALAGGHRTTEGMFAALVSFPNPPGRSVAKTRLQNYDYDSLIDLFDAHGYYSAFFQGTAKETSGTGALAQALGFHESYGKDDVSKRRYGTNSWGIHDPDLYRFALGKLEAAHRPFVIGINGATTHDNKLPDGVKPLHFSDDPRENGILNALHFADAALGDFVAEVKKRWPDTLFVFFADHCGGVSESTFQNYMIPLAFYGRGIEAKKIDAFVSQRDIAPTVVDLVFGNYKKLMPNFTGKSLVTDTHFFADYYHDGVYGWVEGTDALEYTPAARKVRCLDVSGFHPRPVECTPRTERFRARLTAFGDLTQRLLFSGKTKTFHLWRYPNAER